MFPFGVFSDEIANDALVAFEDGGKIFLARKVAAVDALGEGVDEHARARGLEVVALAITLIRHLPPQPGGRILPPNDTVGDASQDFVDVLNFWMRGGEEVE